MAVAAAFSLGALAWIIDQGVGYPLVQVVCASGNKTPLPIISAGAFVLAVAGCWIGARAATRAIESRRFTAMLAVGFDALIALLVLTAAVAPFIFRPCE
jgi:hypothetical protein